MQLIKAIIIEDIDLMEKLGIYEVVEEDFALCEFVDTSKTNIQAIVRKGLKPVPKKSQVTLRIDADVLQWFKATGRGYQTRINSLLRIYMEESENARRRKSA